jgi:hypothetical protein
VTELRSGITDLQESLKETREKEVYERKCLLKSLQGADAERTREPMTLRAELRKIQGRPR